MLASEDRRPARAGRVLVLLVILLGLLAMHGLASSHHAPAGASERVASGPAGGAAAAAEMRHGTHPPAGVAVALAPASGPAPDGTCSAGCATGLATLCLAVLVTGVALIAAGLRRHAVSDAAPLCDAGRVHRLPTARPHAPPSPDPVRELCVSRT